MPLYPTWPEIAARLGLALIASFCIGLNRDEHGKGAGLRTTMLVCMAATLAMLQANILLPTAGKTNTSFAVLDLERLPLGILDGIGFIGAGAILRKGRMVSGLTTAATLWVVTVLGLLFGAGQLVLGSIGSVITFLTLWALKAFELRLRAERSATLRVAFGADSDADEATIRSRIASETCRIASWTAEFTAGARLRSVNCELYIVLSQHAPSAPRFVREIAAMPEVENVCFTL